MDLTIAVLVICGISFIAGMLVGMRNSAALTADLVKAKADLEALKAKLP